jgi:lipopolysaccharide export system protein LptA
MNYPAKILTLVCLSATLMAPLPVNAASDMQTRDRGPVKVTADQLEADDEKQTLVFSGNAVAVQGDITVYADRLTVEYSGAKRELQKVIAEGHVRIIQGTRVATGGKAILYQIDERIVLTESPKVTDGDDYVQGDEITIFLNDKRSVVTSGQGGRVNAVFTPKGGEKP